MQKSGDAVILMNKSEIRYLVGNDKLEVKPFPIYSDMAILLLDTLSRELRNDKEAREYPDILTFAFWCRRANITKLKEEYRTQFLRIGRGLIFHIAPSNVPINFAFSLAFGILAGNANVVRVSEKDFPQTKIVCRILKNLLENPEFTLIRKQTQIVSYGHIKDINDSYSYLCAVQPTSCRTFRNANSRPPFWPKLILTVSMALRPVRPPMRPASSIMAQPMMWPMRIAAKPFAMPSGAKDVPVRISASEPPAPNQIRPFWKVEVFFIR